MLHPAPLSRLSAASELHPVYLYLHDWQQLEEHEQPGSSLQPRLAQVADALLQEQAWHSPWKSALQIQVTAPSSAASPPALSTDVQSLMRTHWRAQRQLLDTQLRRHFRMAHRAAAVGFVFMALCMALRSLTGQFSGVIAQTLTEGLMVIGWVGLWRPLEMYLYDWWDDLRRIRCLQRLEAAPVCLHAAPCVPATLMGAAKVPAAD